MSHQKEAPNPIQDTGAALSGDASYSQEETKLKLLSLVVDGAMFWRASTESVYKRQLLKVIG